MMRRSLLTSCLVLPLAPLLIGWLQAEEELAQASPAAALPAPAFVDTMQSVLSSAGRAEWLEGLVETQVLFDAAETGVVVLSEYEQAELQFARGFLALQMETDAPTVVPALLGSVPAFESTRALSGPTRLRLDATYDLGLTYFLTGDRWRAHLPEIAQSQNAPVQVPLPEPPPPAPGADPSEAPAPPDPLEMARTLYLSAKEVFLERLRADWNDEDTRANLELLQRRLRELEEIEQQREQQEQEQEDQEQEEGEEGEEGEESEESEEGEEGEDQEGEQQEGEDEGEQQESDENQEGDPEDQQESEEPDPDAEPQKQEPQESETTESGGEAQSGEEQTEERHLTREEVMRLLDELGDLEEQREALEAALQKAQRIPVDRDW